MGVLLWSGKEMEGGLQEEDAKQAISLGVCALNQDEGSSFCEDMNVLNQPYTCKEDETCKETNTNPSGGFVSFDNLLWSMLTLFTVSTLEGWHEVMMITQRVMSQHTFWFFLVLIISATYAIMSLMIAAILARFKAVNLAEGLRLMREKEKVQKPTHFEGMQRVIQGVGLGSLNKYLLGTTHASLPINFHLFSTLFILSRRSIEIQYSGWRIDPLSLLCQEGCNPDGRMARTLRIVREAWDRLIITVRHPKISNAVQSEDSFFSQVIYIAIVGNIAVLAMGGHGVGDGVAKIRDAMSLSLTIMFAIEMSIKLVVLGRKRYFKTRWNRFDCFISVGSLVELSLQYANVDEETVGLLGVMKMLRLFRVLKIGRLAKTVKTVLGIIGKSAWDLWPIVMLMLLIMFVFTILGMQLFGGVMDPDLEEYADAPHALQVRFDTFFWSFVFSIIAGDDWVSIMHQTIGSTNVFASLYFVLLIFVILNLMLAVVLEGASDQMKGKHEHNSSETTHCGYFTTSTSV
ncbi:unnamed protein product [Choristocarpus tenellus]